MAEKDEVFEIIKSLITSQKGGVLLKDINRDYRNLAGSHIPYKTLGYRSIEELLGDIPEIKSHENDNGQLVLINKGKNCEHLVKLVSKQKGSSVNKVKPSNPVRNLKNVKSRYSDVGTFKYERNKEKENYVKGLDRSSVSDGRDFKKRACIQSSIHEPNTGVRSRKCVDSIHPNPNIEGTMGWKLHEHIEESAQFEYEEKDAYDPVVGDRAYRNKPLSSFRRRESFHGFSKQENMGFDGLRKFMDDLRINDYSDVPSDEYVSDTVRKGDKRALSQRPKSFRAERCDHLMDIPSESYGEVDFSSLASGSHFKYVQSQKYRKNGSLRCTSELPDWDANTYNHMSDGRSAMGNRSRFDENDNFKHTGRKINVISGSLRVTIKNC